MTDLIDAADLLLRNGSMLALFILLFLAAKTFKQWLTPYSIQQELTGEDNLAQAASMAGYYAGFTILFIGAYLGPSVTWWQDLLVVTGYTLMGLILLNVSRSLNDCFILHGFSLVHALKDQHNTAAGVILGANYLASALIVAGAIHGEGGGPLTALAFYALAQLALTLFSWIYEKLTPYAIQQEVEQGNLAAGLGFGGNLIALGLVITAAINGDFVSWSYNLGLLGLNILGVFIYLLLVRLFFDKVIISQDDLNDEIAKDRNTGAGLLEATMAISFAAILFFMIG